MSDSGGDKLEGWSRYLLAAGLLPLPWFLGWTTLGGLAAAGYDPVARHASELGLQGGTPAAMLSLATLGSGCAFLAFGAGLWRHSGRGLPFGALAWMIFGLAMTTNGIWLMGDPMHGLYGVGVANLIAPALSCLDDEQLRDDRAVRRVTVAVSIAAVLYLWLNLNGFDPPSARGLTQRLFSSINSAWALVVAARLLGDKYRPPQSR